MAPVGDGAGGTNKGIKPLEKAMVKNEKFDGRTEELSRYIFDVTTTRQSDQYARLVKEVTRYVG